MLPSELNYCTAAVNLLSLNLILDSNHGTFYYNQLAALQVLVNDNDGAKDTINGYFDSIYLNQISANGDQVIIDEVKC